MMCIHVGVFLVRLQTSEFSVLPSFWFPSLPKEETPILPGVVHQLWNRFLGWWLGVPVAVERASLGADAVWGVGLQREMCQLQFGRFRFNRPGTPGRLKQRTPSGDRVAYGSFLDAMLTPDFDLRLRIDQIHEPVLVWALTPKSPVERINQPTCVNKGRFISRVMIASVAQTGR